MSDLNAAEAEQARDSSTSPERLGDLADMRPELHPLLLANPSCPTDVRAWILRTNPEAGRAWREEQERERARQAEQERARQMGQERARQVMQERARQAERTQTSSAPAQGTGQSAAHTRPVRWPVVLVLVGVALFLVHACIARMNDSTGGGASTDHSTNTETGPIDKISPAPADAIWASLVETPSQNISCELHDDAVSCSIYERNYADAGQEDCANELFSITVGSGETELACGQEFLGMVDQGVTTLDYGSSVANDSFACSSAEDGMTCWNQWTGHGFKIARRGYWSF